MAQRGAITSSLSEGALPSPERSPRCSSAGAAALLFLGGGWERKRRPDEKRGERGGCHAIDRRLRSFPLLFAPSPPLRGSTLVPRRRSVQRRVWRKAPPSISTQTTASSSFSPPSHRQHPPHLHATNDGGEGRKGKEQGESESVGEERTFFPFPPPPPSFHTLPQHRCSLPPSGLFPPSPPPFSWDPTAENSFFPFSSTRYYTHTTPLPVYINTRYNGGNDNFAFGTRVCGLSHYAGPFRWLPLGRARFLRRKVFYEVSRWGSQIVPGGARGARTYVDCTA